MAEISKINVQGVEYDIEDEIARKKIDAIEQTSKNVPTFVLEGTTLIITAPQD